MAELDEAAVKVEVAASAFGCLPLGAALGASTDSRLQAAARAKTKVDPRNQQPLFTGPLSHGWSGGVERSRRHLLGSECYTTPVARDDGGISGVNLLHCTSQVDPNVLGALEEVGFGPPRVDEAIVEPGRVRDASCTPRATGSTTPAHPRRQLPSCAHRQRPAEATRVPATEAQHSFV